MVKADEPENDAVLTQLGGVDCSVGSKSRAKFHFPCLLRDDDIDGISCYEGRLTTAETKSIVTLGVAAATAIDAVRYTTAGKLRLAGFTVKRTQDIAENHISVNIEEVWDDSTAKAFHDCFDEYRLKGDS